jgi:hypothetical protein
MHTVAPVFAALTDWLTAIGGLLVFAATALLALLAYKQMNVIRQSSADEATAFKKQIQASIEQGEAIREAARAQLQPMVFAHADQIHSGPDDEYMLSDGQMGFGYRLKNEGTGIALNIRHGIEIDGREIEFGEGKRSRALRPGEAQPMFDYLDPQGHFIRITPFAVVCIASNLPPAWPTVSVGYWARFESVFGERFETHNPSDPLQPAEFKRIDGY